MPASATNTRLYQLGSRCYVTRHGERSLAWKVGLVTGASSGIGAALAEELVAGGAHLVLTARRAWRLAGIRRKLRAAHGVRIEVLPADLARPNTPAEIFAFTQERGIAVDLLVNNAGIGSYGTFCASDRERELGIIQLNCSALVHLTHLYLPGMVERRSGAILIVSSTAAYQGVPYMATYAASKGFGLLFAEALAREVEDLGIRVCALCPGPTESEFPKVAVVPDELLIGLEPADRVARKACGRSWRTLGHLWIHELARSGDPAYGSPAVSDLRG